MSLFREEQSEPTAAEPEGRSSLSHAWGLLAALVLVFVAVSLVWQWWTPREWLAERWLEALDEAPEEEVATRVAQIAELDEAGIDPLVECLDSPRTSVVDAASSELGNRLDRWELLPAAESSAKIALLVKAMQSRAAKWPAAPLRTASDFAHRALRWRLDTQTPAAMEIVAGCEAVLRASAALNRTVAAPVSLAVFSEDPSAANPRDSWGDSRASSEILKHVAFDDPQHPPSADLPLDVFPLPAPPPWPAAEGKAAASPAQSEEGPLPITEPALLSPLPGRPVPLAELPAVSGDAAPNRPRAVGQSAEFVRLLAIMRNLHGDAAGVAAAEAALRQAGLDDLRLEIARRITDPDPLKRKDIAEQLPRVPGLDARPWLIALSQDSDLAVAATASRVLATSGDPDLQAAAREGLNR